MLLELSEQDTKVIESILKRESSNIESRMERLQRTNVSQNKHIDEISILREKYKEIKIILTKFNESVN